MPRVAYRDREFQTKIISEMVELLGDAGERGDLPKMSIQKAGKQVSGESDPTGPRRSADSFITISYRTCERWYEHWLDFKQLPCDTNLKWRQHRRMYSPWPQAHLDALKEIVDSCPVLFLDEIGRHLSTRLKGKKFSYGSISKALRFGLRYSRKVVYEKATQQVQRQREEFTETLNVLLESPEMAIYVDESNKDRRAARRKYGWSRVGTPVNYRSLFNMDTRFTLIGVADCFGFVIPACDVIRHRYKEKDEEKPVDSDRFVEFVERKLCPVLGNYARREPRSVVIMDNCSIHLDPRVKALIEACGAIIVYSAPYSPDLIPIEYMFHQWKAYLKRYSISFNLDWYYVHLAALESITPQQGLNYFKKNTLIHLVKNHPLSEEFQITAACLVAATTIIVAVLM